MTIFIYDIDAAMDFVLVARRLGFDVPRARQITSDGWFELRVPMSEGEIALIADSIRIPISSIRNVNKEPIAHRFISP